MSRTQSKALLLYLLAAGLVPGSGRAATVPDLYVAEVPAAALSGEPLDEAFSLALDEVLVRVTGDRFIAADKARRRAVGAATPLVRQYQPVPGGQLIVRFDAAALHGRLDAANLPVWADDRPLTLVILPPELAAMPAPGDPGSASDLAGSFRQQLLAAAASRGVPLLLAPDGRKADDPLFDPVATARGAGADLLLIGRPAPTGGPGFLRWTLLQAGDRAEWQGDAADGAHGLADRLAARYATAADSARVLRLRIDGIDSFDAYGRLQGYLRSVGLVQGAELQRVTGNSMLFQMTVRGDVRQLNDAFALGRVLDPVADSGVDPLVYRLLPVPASPP